MTVYFDQFDSQVGVIGGACRASPVYARLAGA